MKANYKPGQWNAICDICGFEFKSGELRKNWQGLMVCASDFEQRHPQELIRAVRDDPSTEWNRPEPPDIYVNLVMCTLEGQQSLSGIGVAGCMISAYDTPYI